MKAMEEMKTLNREIDRLNRIDFAQKSTGRSEEENRSTAECFTDRTVQIFILNGYFSVGLPVYLNQT